MTLIQAETIAAYSGLTGLIKNSKSSYIDFVSSLLNRSILFSDLPHYSSKISELSKDIYEEMYDSFDKKELAIIEEYTRVHLLKPEDLDQLDKIQDLSDKALKKQFDRICNLKDLNTAEDYKEHYFISKIKYALSNIVVIITIILLISTLAVVVGYMITKSDTLLGASIALGCLLIVSMILNIFL